MNLIIFSKAKIQDYPLVTSLVYAAKKEGYDIKIITQNINPHLQQTFVEKGVEVHSLENKESKSKFLKLLHWRRFSKFACKFYNETSELDKIWVTGADTAICIGNGTLKKRKFYFQINELYDKFPNYLKRIKRIAQFAHANVVPERNRAAMFQIWFDLKEMPFILPNKPFFEDELITQGTDKNREYIEFLKAEKSKGQIIFLYQGHLGQDRDLTPLIKAISKNKRIQIVLMGHDHGVLQGYQKSCPSIYYIPSISAPFHLLITQLSDIGMLMYLPISLNNVYCAPNKIWEYARYGLALIGNDIVGLDCITHKEMGVQCNIEDDLDLDKKLELLMSNIELYKKNSLNFYESFDFETDIKHLLEIK